MTTLEALEKSILIWTHVAKYNMGKPHAYKFLNLEMDDAHCPLCEYVTQLKVSCTAGCPLWRRQEDLCISGETNYSKWVIVHTNDKPLYAKALLQQLKNSLISYDL